MFTHEDLRKMLDYDPETGILIWHIAQSRRVRIGEIAGYKGIAGYIRVAINRKTYAAHRLIWFWMTGHWPTKHIDHKDRNRANNRWSNLREATRGQNKANSKTRSRHGVKGVVYDARGKTRPWRAQIVIAQQHKWLGYFTTKEAAHAAYCAAAKKAFGDFFVPQ